MRALVDNLFLPLPRALSALSLRLCVFLLLLCVKKIPRDIMQKALLTFTYLLLSFAPLVFSVLKKNVDAKSPRRSGRGADPDHPDYNNQS